MSLKTAMVEQRNLQLQIFARLLELLEVPFRQRPRLMGVAELFLDSGWPSKYLTLALCEGVCAGSVPPPPPYRGAESVAAYEAMRSGNGHALV